MIGFVDAAFAWLAPYVGIPKDHVKLVTILYIAVPLCSILKRLPDNKPHLKNIYSIALVSFKISLMCSGFRCLFS